MIQHLLADWKTTSTALLMIVGAVVHLVYAARAGTANENTWTFTAATILAGLGIMFSILPFKNPPPTPPPATPP